VTSTGGGRRTVLVVDDQQDVADSYALGLEERYETRVAYGGEAALEVIDEDVDAVVLDRRMPDVHGDDVLAEIRERGYDCVVVMATAVEPDLNILEMDFDDYLSKPIGHDQLRETIERHLETRKDDRLSEFFRLVSRLEVVREELPDEDLADSDEYDRLQERARELGAELEADIQDFQAVVETYREIDRK